MPSLPLFADVLPNPPEPRAHARGTDPDTSQVAAGSLTPARLTLLQVRVLILLPTPATDADLVQRWRAAWPTDRTRGSSIRTRRHELVTAGLLESVETVTLPSGRRGSVWQRTRRICADSTEKT
jgi:hypothetical protein